tara:strand:+ start:950 stop:1909 length:960 start_codon:yes stop_codon:yes gene_type:complete
MKKKISIIVGGSGQLGISLAKLLLKKKYKVIVTTRNLSLAAKKIPIRNKNLKLIKLDVLKKNQINSMIENIKPKIIYYFAGQSSPVLSYKKNKITYLSNVKGCENFLKILYEKKIKTKFVNASSSEIFSKSVKKIGINSKKEPISPYGKAKLISFNITKFFREKKKLNTYNVIIFNTESYYREKNYLIPKICIAAIKAKRYGKKTFFGNLDVSREWNWSDEQVIYLMKFVNKKPQDFILSNGYSYSAKKMLSYAFEYFNLNYKLFTKTKKNYIRKKDFLIKKSNFTSCLNRNNIKRNSKVHGKKLINLMIKFYLNEKKT